MSGIAHKACCHAKYHTTPLTFTVISKEKRLCKIVLERTLSSLRSSTKKTPDCIFTFSFDYHVSSRTSKITWQTSKLQWWKKKLQLYMNKSSCKFAYLSELFVKNSAQQKHTALIFIHLIHFLRAKLSLDVWPYNTTLP